MTTRFFAALALLTFTAFAQSQGTQSQNTQTQSTPTQSTQTQSTQSQPAQSQPTQTSDTQSQDTTQQSDEQTLPTRYEGPSILSRDRSLIGERGGKLLDYRFYGAVSGAYDSSLTPVSVNQNGNLNQTGGTFGTDISFGVDGTKTWRRDKLAIDYSGDYSHFAGHGYFDGLNQFLNMSYAHALSRHFYIQTRVTAGESILTTGAYTYLPLANTDLYAVPTNELFDNPTYFGQGRVDATWQKTLRLSFNFGGEVFVVRRQSDALSSMNGYNGHADIAYRLTKRQTISVSFERTQLDYLREFGNANIMMFEGGYSIGLGRRWDFGSKFGAARIDMTGLTIANLDPAVAAIIGQNSAVVVFHRTSFIPVFEADLTRRFERSSLSASFNQSFSPGDGVYLTSKQTAASLGYSYTGLKRVTYSASGGYSTLTSLGQTLGTYRGEYAGAGFTYRISGITHFEARYDFRHYTTQGVGYRQNDNHVSIGLAFSPGAKPLPIW